ncbi:MAG TPA: glucoamylase family protein, partial [Puia sp.]|nr:glucoamylase family protein [Puia sp.]
LNPSFDNNDSTIVIRPAAPLRHFTSYILVAGTGLKSRAGGKLRSADTLRFITSLDSSDKFPRISDSALLDLVERQTFTYFWDFGHPISGLARERTSSGDLVTTGGSGFGIMAMLAATQRGFITRQQSLTRIDTIVSFLTTKATRYHGAFSHWMNGATGATIPFSANDDGGDIVETSYLLEGLLCARQYFNSATDPQEISLRMNVNAIWKAVDWNWYRQGGQNVLYWNWSPDHGWAVNVAVRGWNEALITYVLAASADPDSIPKTVYDNGWAANGAMQNNRSYYGIRLPLGPDYGGPLFFAHYSFLGIDPHGLTDAYASYWTQDTAHARINYLYCIDNPKHYFGYSNLCWGLTASDEQNGYSAHSPTNDYGVVAPTAAISSMPYTPTESMNALRFFYYTLGDKLWKGYGFIDAFDLATSWYDTDFLAIDQGPEIVMIENYRSGLLWNLFMSCPEIQQGMKTLGFSSPHF